MSKIRFAFAAMALLAAERLLAGGLMISEQWVREPPPGMTALAGYMQLHNHGGDELVLVGADSPAFAEVMLHRSVMEDGVMRMLHQESISIPAGGMLSFEPGGYHLMLMQPKRALKAGDSVEVTLHFEGGSSQTLDYPVRAGGMGGMNHGQMQHHNH